MYDLSKVTPEHFECLIGQTLPLINSGYRFEVRSVERLRSPSPRLQPFSVTLLAPPGTRGAQGIYIVEHPDLGQIELFLVPIDSSADRLRFEAVFN